MMLSIIRKRLTYANVMMSFALIFAMSGGAYAAHRYLITSTKQISPKVLKVLKGARGSVGPEGKAGSPGPTGPVGKDGANGMNGTNGKDGANGISVTSRELTSKDTACNKEGGSEFTAANGKTVACNGKEGSPWTAGGTLPKGKTETGEWTLFENGSALRVIISSVSFDIPLAAPLDKAHVHYIQANGKETIFNNGTPEEVEPTECKGKVSEPTAESGNLCVYGREESKMYMPSGMHVLGSSKVPWIVPLGTETSRAPGQEEGADRMGFGLGTYGESGQVALDGTWAVTAP